MKSSRFHILSLGALFAFINAWGEESANEADLDQYFFIGGSLSAAEGKSYFPIASVTKRHLYVDKGSKLKRLSNRVPVIVQLKPALSDRYIELSAFDVSFSSSLPALIEARAVSEAMRHEMGTDLEIASLPKIESRGPRWRLNYDQIENLNRDTQEFQDNLRDQVDYATDVAENQMDTVHLEFELTPDRDYRDVYAAVAISYAFPRRDEAQRGSQVFARFIGDLEGGKSELVKLRASLVQFRAFDTRSEVFLFDGEGTPIATNLSRRLQKMTAAEVAAMLEGAEQGE